MTIDFVASRDAAAAYVVGASLFLGLSLILAGGLKLRRPDALVDTLSRVLPKSWTALRSKTVVRLMATAETALGGLLTLHLLPPMIAALICSALFGIFCGILVRAHRLGANCGCFGELQRYIGLGSDLGRGLIALAISFGLVVAAWLVPAQMRGIPWIVSTAVAASLLGITALAYRYGGAFSLKHSIAGYATEAQDIEPLRRSRVDGGITRRALIAVAGGILGAGPAIALFKTVGAADAAPSIGGSGALVQPPLPSQVTPPPPTVVSRVPADQLGQLVSAAQSNINVALLAD